MADYIKREDAILSIQRMRIGLRKTYNYDADIVAAEIIERIEDEDRIPAADVAEVRDWNLAVKRVQESFDKLTDKGPNAVPVVRCRECKYCSPGLTREERSIPDADLVCAYWDSDGLDANDFCSHGERKGGDE